MCVWLDCNSVAVNMQIRFSIEVVSKTCLIRANRKPIPYEVEPSISVCQLCN
jgi:hypothetical protein